MRTYVKRLSIWALGLTRSRFAPVALALSLAASVTLVDGARPAAATHSTVTSVQGSAFGYHADNITLFGGPQPDTGPTPTVALASDASNSPAAATATTGSVQYGPAILFDSGQIDVASSGSLGPSGSATSSTALEDVNAGEVLTADLIVSSCAASSSATSASTTVTNGIVRTHQGAEDHDEGVVAIPATPAPNYTVEGHVHMGGSQDTYRIVFNEQVMAGSSLTVNAVHVYYLGPTLTGDLIIGQAVCGVTTQPVQHPPEAVQPVGDIGGPCADPAYYGIFDNTASTVAVKFRFRWYTRLGLHSVRKTVPAGAIYRTWEHWVKPFTIIRVGYKNPTTGKWVNLAKKESVKGNYPPCEYKRGFTYP